MKRPLETIVVGSGVAGMAFALQLVKLAGPQGVNIRLLSKAGPEQSNSNAAQGGVAAVIRPSDSWEQHRDDTLAVGAGRCEVAVVERVVKEGPQCIAELLRQGARFDTDEQGGLETAREGGHSTARVVHRGDRTGAELVRVLHEQVKRTQAIRLDTTAVVLDLLVEDLPDGRRCTGVRTLDPATGAMKREQADAMVLATGGSGRMYRHTTNPTGATGAGVAMAIRAGVALRDMAFVQFHPTALYAPEEPGTFLISEAVRGAGAVLLRHDGSRLMNGVHPMADLAPRNVVARAIHAEMRKEHVPHVWLDATHIGQARFAREFPMILDHCWTLGLDPLKEPIPVMPAAHYQCGGIRTDADGRSELPGLYALGECASSGLHGADRLASNSLLEALVIPRHAAVRVMEEGPFQEEAPWCKEDGRMQIMPASATTSALHQRLCDVMMDGVGIVRDDAGLQAAAEELLVIKRHVDALLHGGERSLELLELRDMVLVGRAVCLQAMLEPGNAGAHWNRDKVAAAQPCTADIP